ncbi:PAS and ANTAR domain-containing protein [Cellulomonas sp. SLBN-39]|uniref:PAS and ANTAR domain-containing protein n=1 Tax=Cellulomonas sp. SLBN-39 TaxID=2768446 RepID=UPI001151BCD8|nr:PAS and ANTAR domain-containing protein [Cellulomonas sp. SLBN-39]TQL04265.1 PAS domain-containing protein [Cellulomonas sp. SLBN-39]
MSTTTRAPRPTPRRVPSPGSARASSTAAAPPAGDAPARGTGGAAAGAGTAPAPRLTGSPAQGTWWWSDGCYALHGFTPGDVVPTTELMRAHVHAEDRQRWWDALTDEDTTPRQTRFRLRDAGGRERTVVGVCRGLGDGRVEAVLVDLTSAVAAEGARLATEQIAASAASRATIEQAKGVVAAAYGVSVEAAFAVLREASMRSNVGLRAVAARLVAHVEGRGTRAEALAADVAPFLVEVAPARPGQDPS